MAEKIKVIILDDHQAIIDGYLYRLSNQPDIEVVGTILYGEQLEPLLAKQKANVLILDVSAPSSPDNQNPYPILYIIPKLLTLYPNMAILVISMHNYRTLIRAVMDAGANGYVLKDDQATITELPSVVRTVAKGGVHLSQQAFQMLSSRKGDDSNQPLSGRQIEALSLCAAYPDASTSELAKIMHIEGSTMRTMLSGAYLKLDVRTRASAVDKARRQNLITPLEVTPTLTGYKDSDDPSI